MYVICSIKNKNKNIQNTSFDQLHKQMNYDEFWQFIKTEQ